MSITDLWTRTDIATRDRPVASTDSLLNVEAEILSQNANFII